MNEKLNSKMLTGIYIRVSTEEQVKDGFSINAQRNKLTKYAEVNDWDIIDYYTDDGISGKNLTERPEVTRLINDVKLGRINNILVYKLDRLTRSVRDLIDLIELFESHNCCFNSVTEKIDTSNAVGRMFVKIIGIFAEFERENLAERVSFGYEQKAKEGNYLNTNGVYGYDYVVGENRLEVNEYEKQLVSRIFDEYIEGKSYFKIAQILNIEQVPTKRGGHWAASTIKSILHNPLYLGKVRYGVGTKNKDKSFIVEGKNFIPIIDKDKWNLAQDIINIRKNYCTRRYSSDNAYFFHIIRCSKCGSNILARQQKQKGRIYITYYCSKRKVCNTKGFSHKKLENSFLKYLSSINNFNPTNEIISNIDNTTSKKILLEKNISKFKNKKKIIRQEFINDNISLDEYSKLVSELDLQINTIKKEIDNLRSKIDNNNYKYDKVKDIVVNIKLNWEYLTNNERKQFLERFINKIEVISINNEVVINKVEYNN